MNHQEIVFDIRRFRQWEQGPSWTAVAFRQIGQAIRAAFIKGSTNSVQRRLQLIDRLELGGKRQLMLIVCDGQRFLVGSGAESIQSIIAVGKRENESLDGESEFTKPHASGCSAVVKMGSGR